MFVVLLMIACGDDDGLPDTGVDASDAGRDTAIDSAPDVEPDTMPDAEADADAGEPAAAFCDLCRRDSDCGEAGLCLVLGDGERACGRVCEEDGDCADVDGVCIEEVPGLPKQCAPRSGSCVVSEPGASCGECEGRFDQCVTFESSARCTSTCESDADCPVGMHRCREVDGARVCVEDEGTRSCRVLLARRGVPACDSASACAGGGTCVSGACLASPPCADGFVELGGLCAPDEVIDAMPGTSPCACLFTTEGSLFDEALTVSERERCDLGFQFHDALELGLSADPFRFSFTDRLMGHWPNVLHFGDHVRDSVDDASLSELIRHAARFADEPRAAIAPSSPSFAEALAMLLRVTGAPAQEVSLPAPIGDALAPIVAAVADAIVARDEAVAGLAGTEARYFGAIESLLLEGFSRIDVRRADDVGALRGDVDMAALAQAAATLAGAIEQAELHTLAVDERIAITIETPRGRLAIRAGGDDRYESEDWNETLLLIDLDGDDVYRFPAGATTSTSHGVALVIDVSGADDYGYDEVPVAGDVPEDDTVAHHRLPSDDAGRAAGPPISLSTTYRQGVGVLGIGMLIDLAGNDEYRSLRASQGYGALGVGVLFDREGDDLYHAEALAQGAGHFGIGILRDAEGADRYLAYRNAQGFGYARGVGILHDEAGGDRYVLNPDDVLYPSAQDPERSNGSLGQGFGFGRRADSLPDRLFMSGGLGVLRDRAGDDEYIASIFAQGTGYWFGTGYLLEGGGDDSYEGKWYVQGAGAHFAPSALIEESGNDRYNQTTRRLNVALGGGHDFSISWLDERAGDDVYLSPSLALGAGNQAGTGVFLERGGADTYETGSNFTFGNARVQDDALRRRLGTLGIFLDAGGADTYTRPDLSAIGNDAVWRQTVGMGGAELGEVGVGIDRAGPAI